MFRLIGIVIVLGLVAWLALRQVEDAIETYAMTPPEGCVAPRWLVCLSGGKDSYTLLTLLQELQARSVLNVELVACNLDQAQPGFPTDVLPRHLAALDVPHRIERRDTYSIVKAKTPAGGAYCALCSRLRRGHLYRIAREEGCRSVVLGHHRDDAIETLFLNMLHGGRIAAMPPKLLNDDGDLTVLRPLYFCAEEDIARFAEAMSYPIIPCDLCGSQEGLQRAEIKAMLKAWERESPGRKDRLALSLRSVRLSQLADPDAFDFAGF